MKTFRFDRSALRFGQISLISVLVLGYVFNLPYAIYVGALMLLSALFVPAFAPQLLMYRLFVRNNWANTAIHDEDPAPHRFAQQMGLGVLVIGTVAALAGSLTVAWAATLVVIALALLNVTTGFCAGCFVHAQIAKLRSA
jgi:hypothetical protein